MKRADNTLVKAMNMQLVRETLKRLRQATKQELAQQTGLSVVTINALLRDMMTDNEVQQGDMIPSNGGRPSALYHYNGNYELAAIIVGHQKNNRNYLKLLIVNLFEECLYEEAVYMEQITESSFEPLLDKVVAKYPAISLLAFGLPGAEYEGRILVHDYPELIGDTFIQHYKERYSMPVIYVNDINAAVYGYYYRHSSQLKAGTVVGVYLPRMYGPGAGIMINGELYVGSQHYAGEVGHYPVGCDWSTLDYTDAKAVTEAVGKLIALICVVLAPSHIVLYGDFWEHHSVERISRYAEGVIRHTFSMDVVVSDQFEADFEHGMIQFSLKQFKHKS